MTLRSCLFLRCYKYPSQHCFSCRPHTLMFLCSFYLVQFCVFKKKRPEVLPLWPMDHLQECGFLPSVWRCSSCLAVIDFVGVHCGLSTNTVISVILDVLTCCMAWGLISLGECSILWIQEHSVLPAGLSRGRLWAGGWCGSPTSGLVFCLVVLWVVERTQWSPRPYLQIGCLSSALSASASCILRL